MDRQIAVTKTNRGGGSGRRWATAGKIGGGVLCVAPLVLTAGVALAEPVSATGGFTVASSFASYQPGAGKTPTAVQFDTLTLASGGTPSAATLQITGQPSSGTASANTANGVITYSPTSSTTGNQVVTFQLCEAGPTACQTATLTVGAATLTNNAFVIPEIGGYAAYPTAYGALGPSAATAGSNFSEYFAPASLTVPPSLSLDGITATVNYLAGLDYILPIPANATYVNGSAQVVGGDATTEGQAVVTLCTTTGGTGVCNAQSTSSTFPSATTTPYLELQLSSNLHINASTAVTIPTVVAQFTASGSVGSTIKPQVTEFDAGANVSVLGNTITGTLPTYPVASSFTGVASGNPAPAAVSYPLSTTTIAAVPPAPTVSGVSPSSGPQGGGTSVTITGTNLANATAVDFGSNGATITGDSATSISAVAPAGTGTVNVTVTTGGGASPTSAADQYTYVPAPVITGISPSSGPQTGGTLVTINGSNLSSATAVDFGTAAATIKSDTASAITATAPAGTGTVSVTVTTGSGIATSPTSYSYVAPPPPPSVSGISPNNGSAAGGTSVTISGSNLANATAVDFGANAAIVTSDTATSIVATSPPGLGSVDVTVTTGGGTALAPAQFTYNVPPGFPAVTAIAPATGSSYGGTLVTVTGTNLTNATAVDFGTQPAFFSGVTPTSLTAIAPAGSGTVEVTVTTPSGTSVGTAATQFAYTTPAPAVTALSPASGLSTGGTLVTITGSNFVGATAVHFGTVAAPILANGSSSLTALAPAGTGTVDVTVTTPGGTSAAVAADRYLYVTPAAPTVTAVSPATGPAAGGTVVTVTGTNLSYLAQVDFGTVPAFFTAVTKNSFQAIAPAGSGTVDITVTTPGGTSATGAADRFVYASAALPTVTAVSPGGGPAVGGTLVTISGTGLGYLTAVHFGNAAALVTIDTPTAVTAFAPAGSGTVDVTVTTAAGTSATSTADHFAYGAAPTAPPTITSVSPASGPAAGGTIVTITGKNLLYASTVDFGNRPAFFTDVTGTSLVAVAPPGKGKVEIFVTTPAGRTTGGTPAAFTYVAGAGIRLWPAPPAAAPRAVRAVEAGAAPTWPAADGRWRVA
jgi:hypothetical protein